VDKRTLLTMVICMAILIVWTVFVMPVLSPPPPNPAPVPPAPAPVPEPDVPDDKPPPEVQAGTPAAYPERKPFDRETPHFRVTFSPRGGGIRSLVLRYEKDEVPLLADHGTGIPHLALRDDGGPDPIEKRMWEVVKETPTSVEFHYLLRSGVRIEKTFTLHPDLHLIELAVYLRNLAPPPEEGKPPPARSVKLELLAFDGLEHDSPYRYEQYFTGVSLYENREAFWPLAQLEEGLTEDAAARAIADPAERAKAVEKAERRIKLSGAHKKWFGLKNRFFAALVEPKDQVTQLAIDGYWFRPVPEERRKDYGGLKNIAVSAVTDELKVDAQAKVLEFKAFFGPLRADALKEVTQAERLIAYGGSGCGCVGNPIGPIVGLVAPLILAVLKFFSGLFGNLGVGIIFTTLVIRLCLFPLSKKSQVSMFRMQQLSPKVQALRDRYKDDPQKQQMEQWKLFREHKINPMAGCFPLLLQLPIFIGMYSVFELSIELREAPFFLWMKDLSQPDYLLGPWTPFEIPLLITTLSIDALNLLPILMTITWFLQAYFAPRSPDPQMRTQQKMMMFMPIVFGLMCYGLASGLSLYFFVNSLLGMAEQKLIKKFFLKSPEPGAAPA